MKLSTSQLTQIYSTLKRDQIFLKQLEDPNSPASRLLSAFSLNFILKNLDEKKRIEFLSILTNTQDVTSFIQSSVPNFQKEFALEFYEYYKKIIPHDTKS